MRLFGIKINSAYLVVAIVSTAIWATVVIMTSGVSALMSPIVLATGLGFALATPLVLWSINKYNDIIYTSDDSDYSSPMRFNTDQSLSNRSINDLNKNPDASNNEYPNQSPQLSIFRARSKSMDYDSTGTSGSWAKQKATPRYLIF